MNNLHDENELSALFSDMPAHPQGHEQSEVTHYAYDPQTYEILCRPGQRLSEKKTRRLRELGLYLYVVASTDSHSL